MRQTFSMRAVEGFIEKLKTLPKKEKALSKNETLSAMRGHLRKARDDGYTLEELVELLKEMGIEVSMDTLRVALRERGKKEVTANKSSKRISGLAERNAHKVEAQPGIGAETGKGSALGQTLPLRRSGFVVRPDREEL